MKILIATKNNAKIEGAKKALLHYFDDFVIEGAKVESGVSEQPLNDETWQGAKNRVENLKRFAKDNDIEADMFLAIESGMTQKQSCWMIENVAVIENKIGEQSFGLGPSFPVPDRLVERIKKEGFGDVMDSIFNESQLHLRGGGIEMLTHGKVLRSDLTEQAFVMALTKFINGDIWR